LFASRKCVFAAIKSTVSLAFLSFLGLSIPESLKMHRLGKEGHQTRQNQLEKRDYGTDQALTGYVAVKSCVGL
jgi:hypothetical protein